MATLEERALVGRLEAANVEELAELLVRPGAAEERVLRIHLGDEVYLRLHALALEHAAARRRGSAPDPRGRVVVIPDLLGSELSAVGPGGELSRLWLDPVHLGAGGLAQLQLAPSGLAEHDAARDVRPTGILKRIYGELLLTLARCWEVRAFWYDWRKDLRIAAAQLEAAIDGWFPEGAPVHLVAHGMGAQVARSFVTLYPRRWKSGGKLVMLGPPSHGTFVALEVLTGAAPLLRRLAALDARHGLGELTRIVGTFVGLYQILPSPLLDPQHGALYRAASYHPRLEMEQRRLDAGLACHQLLRDAFDPARMISVEGHGRQTPVGVDLPLLAELDPGDDRAAAHRCFRWGSDGDGVVSHALAALGPEGGGVPRRYVSAGHDELPSCTELLAALDALLLEDAPLALPGAPPELPDRPSQRSAFEAWRAQEKAEAVWVGHLARRFRARDLDAEDPELVGADEREIAAAIVAELLGVRGQLAPGRGIAVAIKPPTIEIRVVWGDPASLDVLREADLPVDALAFGQYQGGLPSDLLRDLDRALTSAILAKSDAVAAPARAAGADAPILEQFLQRGLIRGDLGQPFFIDDPREPGPGGRMIAIMGMGRPGSFGVPQATVLARELCWALGRLGKRHVATRLIGTGRSGLPTRAAVAAWLRGIKHALTGTAGPVIRRITFIEKDPGRLIEIHDALRDENAEEYDGKGRLKIDLEPLSDAEREAYHWRRLEQRRREIEQEAEAPSRPPVSPARITVALEGNRYCFGALTEHASVPEREIPIDRRLVERANDELAAESGLARQVELGQFLGRLLLPSDLGQEVFERAPLLLLLDAVTARIHWELLAALGPQEAAADERRGAFLGMRGVTRQLRTVFAPLPDPPPPRRRVLRAVVVADPAEDAHLPGAEDEGAAVAELFERFNVVHGRATENRVEVVRMFGPSVATRTAVLRQLMMQTCDVLHFAGHCTHDPADPEASGWVFSGREILSARELRRIGRVPRFVFSNACQSGVTPDRSEMRDANLAPSFAEAFFERGVSNFVCTAWPVDDAAASDFALALYGSLLGLDPQTGAGRGGFSAMYEAMIKARRAIADRPRGALTWGAYQHYGNPYFRLFDPGSRAVEE